MYKGKMKNIHFFFKFLHIAKYKTVNLFELNKPKVTKWA